MKKTTVKQQPVIQYSLETTLKNMMADVGELPMQLEEKVKELGLESTGPHIWEYIGADGQPETPFTLRMCLPVKETIGETGGFQFAELPEIQAVTTEHKGAWADLKDTYCAFVPEIMQNGLKMTGLTREVYHVVDMENQEKCVTEIQIEVE